MEELVFVARLPITVLSDIVSHCPIVYWGRFAMSCKGVYELFAKDPEVGEALYRKITLGHDSGAIAAAIRRNKHQAPAALSGLAHYLAHARSLTVVRVKGFDDFHLRQLQGFAPHVVTLSLTSLSEVKGKLGLAPSVLEPDNNDESPATETATAPENPVPFVRPPSALELWTSQVTALHLHAIHVRDSYLQRLQPRLAHIVTLDLSASVIQSALPILGPSLTSLKHLTLDGSWRLRVADLESWALTAPTGLKTLSLKSCEHLSDLALRRVLERCGPSLKTINIKFNQNVGIAGIKALTELANPHMTSVSVSNLSPTIPASIWVEAVSKWTQVKYLDLSLNQGVNDEVVEAVAEHCKSVTNLNLRGSVITDAAIQSLSSGCRHLKFLDTSACNSLKSFPGLGQIEGLLRLSSPEIQTLDVSLLVPQCVQLGTSLKFITKYDLSWTNITDECIEALLSQAFWLAHLSVISCSALTNKTIHAVIKLLSHPLYTASFFSLGICKTPLITDSALREIKQRFCPVSLLRFDVGSQPPLSNSTHALSTATSSNQGSPIASSSTDPGENIVNQSESQFHPTVSPTAILEDIMTISCSRGGKTKPFGLCQCTPPHTKVTTD